MCSQRSRPSQRRRTWSSSQSAPTDADAAVRVPDINIDSSVLASLFGSVQKRDEFFAKDFGRNVAHTRRSSSADLPSPLVGIDLKSLYDTNDYISLRKRGSRDLLDKGEISYQDFTTYINGGGSAIVPIIRTDYMKPFKVNMEEALGQEVSMNVYHSGPSAVALNKHYDSYDVFVLQLEGEKEWIIQTDGERERLRSITQWSNTTMVPGDVLYIPQGIFHAATTAAGFDTTTHVTIGFTAS